MNALLTCLLSISAGTGTVTYITSDAGYIDVGEDSGLKVGDSAKVFRRKRQVGTCEVVEVSVVGARCKSERIFPGDRIVFSGSAVKKEKAEETRKPLAGPRTDRLTEREMTARRKALLKTPLEQRKHKKKGVAALPVRGNYSVKQQFWGVSTAPGGTFARSSIDASVRYSLDAGFAPLVLTGAARVSGDLIAPQNQRFRPGELVELYVFALAASVEEGPVVGSLGRFRPRLAPGITVMDGVQAGFRFLGDTAEAGVYAGAAPDLINLLPSPNRLMAGTYFGLDFEAAPGFVILPRVRLGALSTADFARARGELEVQTEFFWARVLNLGGSVRTGIGGTDDNLPSLDAARVDFAVTAIEALRFSTSYRFRNAPVIDFDAGALALGAFSLGAAHQGSANATYTLSPTLAFGATAGGGYDVDADLFRGWAGPELSLPKALGALGGMSFGYLEEIGALAGRSAFVQANANVFGVQYAGRGSYFEHDALDDPFREAGLMLLVDAPILPWMSVRGRGYMQQALGHIGGVPRPTPTLLIADVGIAGGFR